MFFSNLCEWLQGLPFAVAIAESTVLFPAIETIHVLALVLVVGSIAMVDLRLLGVTSKGRSVRALSRDVLPVTWVAFAVAASSGFLMFASKAQIYLADTPFQLKVLALLLAGFNMLAFHFITYRDVEAWDLDHPAPPAARVAGGLSLLFWLAVVTCGRWIGFTI